MTFIVRKTPKRHRDLIAAIDIGNSKICCAIARPEIAGAHHGNLRILGVGQQISRGIKNGMVVHLESLENSILNAVHSAEQMASETISEVYVSISSQCTENHTVAAEIILNGATVEHMHIQKLLSAAKQSIASESHQILHAIPLNYTLDDHEGIHHPQGMIGQKLGVSLYCVTAPITLLKNLANCIGRCHLDVIGFAVSAYGSGLSTLVEDELELGCTLVDIGGGTCHIASFVDGHLMYVDSVPLGGMFITSDIARGLSTPLAQAERLKTLYGTVIDMSQDDRETILIPQLGEDGASQANHISKSLLTRIVRARVEEILELIWKHLEQSGMDRLVGQRIIFTGGSSQLNGVRELAMEMWGRQVRVAQPQGLLGTGELAHSPAFATCAGLLKFAQLTVSELHMPLTYDAQGTKPWHKVLHWMRENF